MFSYGCEGDGRKGDWGKGDASGEGVLVVVVVVAIIGVVYKLQWPHSVVDVAVAVAGVVIVGKSISV